jgi:hypothetical protein
LPLGCSVISNGATISCQVCLDSDLPILSM